MRVALLWQGPRAALSAPAFWTAVAKRSGDTAFARAGARRTQIDFVRSQSTLPRHRSAGGQPAVSRIGNPPPASKRPRRTHPFPFGHLSLVIGPSPKTHRATRNTDCLARAWSRQTPKTSETHPFPLDICPWSLGLSQIRTTHHASRIAHPASFILIH